MSMPINDKHEIFFRVNRSFRVDWGESKPKAAKQVFIESMDFISNKTLLKISQIFNFHLFTKLCYQQQWKPKFKSRSFYRGEYIFYLYFIACFFTFMPNYAVQMLIYAWRTKGHGQWLNYFIVLSSHSQNEQTPYYFRLLYVILLLSFINYKNFTAHSVSFDWRK